MPSARGNGPCLCRLQRGTLRGDLGLGGNGGGLSPGKAFFSPLIIQKMVCARRSELLFAGLCSFSKALETLFTVGCPAGLIHPSSCLDSLPRWKILLANCFLALILHFSLIFVLLALHLQNMGGSVTRSFRSIFLSRFTAGRVGPQCAGPKGPALLLLGFDSSTKTV